MKQILGFGLPISATLLILLFSGKTEKIGIKITESNFLNHQLNYQLALFLLALSYMIFTILVAPESKQLLQIGKINAGTSEVKWLGIKGNSNWLKEGISLSIVITLVTGVFLYFSFKSQIGSLLNLKGVFFWILLLAAFNAFSEEIIYRLTIVGNLESSFSIQQIALISGLIFGLSHMFGTPSGIVGLALSGVLGFVLTLSLKETNGLFWAWTIHFLQDILIIGVLYLKNA